MCIEEFNTTPSKISNFENKKQRKQKEQLSLVSNMLFIILSQWLDVSC